MSCYRRGALQGSIFYRVLRLRRRIGAIMGLGNSKRTEPRKGELLDKVVAISQKMYLSDEEDMEASKVVEFLQPKDLMEIMKLEVGSEGASREEALSALEKATKYSVNTRHPHFYNQLYGGIDEVALAGAWLTEALNTNLHIYEVAPVFILVERYIVGQVLQLFGLGDGDGIFAPGGSMANMYGMTLARHHYFPETRSSGLHGMKPIVAYTSDQGHYSITKTASLMGIGRENVICVATDEFGAMVPSALREAIRKTRDDGKLPFFVNATAGTTVFGAYDPFSDIADICQDENIWMHIDACLGGTAILSETRKALLNGCERADSISWNAHKMLGAPLQCTVFVVRHKDLLQEANGLKASYLFQQDRFYDVSYDTGDKSLQCGRKSDAFKLWFMLKVHGLQKLGQRVDAAFEAARYLESQVMQRQQEFRIVQSGLHCTNVCFWFIPPSLRGQAEDEEWRQKLDGVAPKIKERMMMSGTLMVGYQPMRSKNYVNFFRMVTTCFPVPTNAHMDFVLAEIARLGHDL